MSKAHIAPQNANLDWEGTYSRRWFVRLPHGMILDDLKDPEVWSAVQTTRNPLKRHDLVYAVGYSEDFALEARVTDTNATSATLAFVKTIAFPERTVPLFSDEAYKVIWGGDGFRVERIADGKVLGPGHGSEALAVRYLQSLYPRSVATHEL